MERVYRIQPAGHGLDHRSEDSAGDSLGLHVFPSIGSAIHCDECPTVYGDEVVEISAADLADNDDVEGAIIPADAVDDSRIVRRWTLEGFARFAAEQAGVAVALDEDGPTLAYDSCPTWEELRRNVDPSDLDG